MVHDHFSTPIKKKGIPYPPHGDVLGNLLIEPREPSTICTPRNGIARCEFNYYMIMKTTVSGHGWCLIRDMKTTVSGHGWRHELLTLRKHLRSFPGFGASLLLIFLVFLRPVYCVINVASVSGIVHS